MEFIQVVIFIMIIIAVLYRNIQKEDERARKRNIAKPAPAETCNENTGLPTAHTEYENKQMTPGCLSQATTVNSPIQARHRPPKKCKTEKIPDKESEKRRNKKNATSTNIKLNTAEEARCAFIYSEIFNRKY